MKIARIIFVCVCLVGFTQLAWSQKPASPQHGILGYLDPVTGTFKPLVQNPAPSEEAEMEAPGPTTGKFVFSFTITISSTNLSGDTISCQAEASAFDVTRSLDESASVKATVSGSTATCTVTIPYSWTLTTPTTDMVSLSYTIYATSSTGQPTRTSSQTPLATIKVPTSGATTTETIKATI